MFTTIFIMLAGIAQVSTEDNTVMGDEQFVQEIRVAVEQATAKNKTVEILGWGTASLLDSHRESKVKCGRGNPNPKPGECSDVYPIHPEPKPLTEVIANEQSKQVEATSTETVWVAWRDLNGLNIAFNNPSIGDYEMDTITEVKTDKCWSAIRIYEISVKIAKDEWVQGPKINKAGFTWLVLGQENDLRDRLRALEDIGTIKDASPVSDDLLERFAEWQSINPEGLTTEQKNMVEQFNQIGELPNDTLQFIGLFPWIDVKNLTIRDKVFIMETAKDYEKYLAISLLG